MNVYLCEAKVFDSFDSRKFKTVAHLIASKSFKDAVKSIEEMYEVMLDWVRVMQLEDGAELEVVNNDEYKTYCLPIVIKE